MGIQCMGVLRPKAQHDNLPPPFMIRKIIIPTLKCYVFIKSLSNLT